MMRGWSHKPAGGSWASAELAVGSRCDCGSGAARGLDDHCDDCRPRLFRVTRGRATGDTQRAPAPATGGLIVEDDTETLTAGQMRKSEFLRQLRGAACAAADAAMAEVGRSTAGCPYVDRMLSLHAGRPARQIERAMRLYAPEARGAASAADYLMPVSARVARGAAHWARTGSLPEDTPAELRGATTGAVAGLRGALGAGAGLLGGVASAMGRLVGKGKVEGAARADRGTPAQRVGEGRPHDAAERPRRDGAPGGSMADVHLHTDESDVGLAREIDARPSAPGDRITSGAGTPTPTARTLEDGLTGKRRWTSELAVRAMEEYHALGGDDRELWIRCWAPLGQIGNMLRALDRSAGGVDGRFAGDLRDLLGRLQEWGIFESVQATGLADEATKAWVPADSKVAKGVAKTVAKTDDGVPRSAPPPTPDPAGVEKHGQAGARPSIAPMTGTLTSEEEDTIKADLADAIPKFVAWCTRTHPELGIAEDLLLADPRRVFHAGAHVIAVSDGAGHAVVGREFVEKVKAHPASALPAVVREMFGRPGRGTSSPSDSYAMEFYNKAAARMPGYARPIGAGRKSELEAYGYPETETHAEMREIEYTASSDPRAVDSEKEVIEQRIPDIIAQWDPRIAKALLRGFYLRLRSDPRVTAHALDTFRSGIKLHVTTSRGFAPGDAKDILK